MSLGEPRAYNRWMIRAIHRHLGAAVTERIALLVNHVLQGEASAVERLRQHTGKRVQFHFSASPVAGWLPEQLTVEITPAGLIEVLLEDSGAPDLRVSVDASRPVKTIADALSGQRPAVEVSGDAGLAADVAWLVDNLRWDVQDDLARVVGAGAAAALSQFVGTASAALRSALGALVESGQRLRRMATGESAGSEPPAR
jgi:ubiquinone biosynthesis protein UbiJ